MSLPGNLKERSSIQLREWGEYKFLEWLLPRVKQAEGKDKSLRIGSGDDAAVIRFHHHKNLLLTTDTLIAGTHFPAKNFYPRAIGYKSLTINLSDLAAMGAVKPRWALANWGLPPNLSIGHLRQIWQGWEISRKRWGITLVGGDIFRSTRLILTVTVLGEAKEKFLVRRDSARPGEWVGVTGFLGDAAAGCRLNQQKSLKELTPAEHYLWRRFWFPSPRLAEGALLGKHGWAKSMLDLSDSLAQSLNILAKAAGVGFRIFSRQLPLSPSLRCWLGNNRRRNSRRYLLYGGEDYELLFTFQPRFWPVLKSSLPKVQVIGEVVPAKAGITLVDFAGQTSLIKPGGYEHFS